MSSEMDALFGILAFGSGIYCLYSAITMQRTGNIAANLVLDRETAKKKCKNVGEFLYKIIPPTYILGSITTAYGVISLVDAFLVECPMAVNISLVVTIVAFIWFAVATSNAKKKYYD